MCISWLRNLQIEKYIFINVIICLQGYKNYKKIRPCLGWLFILNIFQDIRNYILILSYETGVSKSKIYQNSIGGTFTCYPWTWPPTEIVFNCPKQPPTPCCILSYSSNSSFAPWSIVKQSLGPTIINHRL